VPDETEQLTAAMSRGDRRAVAAFYERYFDLLVRCARGATRIARRADVEDLCLDVVHDAVLRIVRTIRPVTGGEGQLVAWLNVVVKSAAYDRLRREQRRLHREQASTATAGAAAAPAPQHDRSPHVGNGAELAEQLAWLRDVLGRLDPKLVELIELRYTHGWTLLAIAERLGLSAGTVDGRIRRALEKMRLRGEEVFGERR
jgi:RNA polymerase sigma factor (sigma-70 family)